MTTGWVWLVVWLFTATAVLVGATKGRAVVGGLLVFVLGAVAYGVELDLSPLLRFSETAIFLPTGIIAMAQSVGLVIVLLLRPIRRAPGR